MERHQTRSQREVGGMGPQSRIPARQIMHTNPPSPYRSGLSCMPSGIPPPSPFSFMALNPLLKLKLERAHQRQHHTMLIIHQQRLHENERNREMNLHIQFLARQGNDHLMNRSILTGPSTDIYPEASAKLSGGPHNHLDVYC
uniref:Uncharacterized protein n=1 Tax=Attheya septentrionalis TaxID=420275 RepID=A0A7S2UNB9_9STRA|mmetsp:Transcript_29580/g.54194  ORF Transcript_29580/g.54194 Transcript_29580/m.54194 type:complete len:142 (+) Transcript_29580:192-617(+)